MRLVDTYDDAATVSRLSCLESSCWGRRGQWRGGVPAREGSWDAEQTARCLGTAPLRDLARSLGQVNSTVLAWLRWSCTQHRRACCAVGSLSQWFWPVELRPVIVIIENIGLGARSEGFSVSMLPSSYTTSRTYNWRRLEYNIPFGTSLSNLRTTASHLHLHLLLLPHLPQPPLSSSLSLSSSSFLLTLSSLHLSLPHPTNFGPFHAVRQPCLAIPG